MPAPVPYSDLEDDDGYGDKPKGGYGGYYGEKPVQPSDDDDDEEDVCLCGFGGEDADKKYGLYKLTGEPCECEEEEVAPPEVLKVVSATTTLTVTSFGDVDIAALKADLLASISESAGGARMTAVVVLTVTSAYSFPDGLLCAVIKASYATATAAARGVALDDISVDCEAGRRSRQEITFSVTVPVGDMRAIVGEREDIIAGIAAELGIDVAEIVEGPENYGIQIVSGYTPPCNPGCPEYWVDDGTCDSACNNAECGFDGDDCKAFWCAPGCDPDWVDDGICDSDCNNAECGYDGADCDDAPELKSWSVLDGGFGGGPSVVSEHVSDGVAGGGLALGFRV